MRSDKELLDALEEQGMGVALIHDDNEHWFVVTDGMQTIVENGPQPFQTSYWVDDEAAALGRKTVREAINAWLDSDD